MIWLCDLAQCLPVAGSYNYTLSYLALISTIQWLMLMPTNTSIILTRPETMPTLKNEKNIKAEMASGRFHTSMKSHLEC